MFGGCIIDVLLMVMLLVLLLFVYGVVVSLVCVGSGCGLVV